MAGTLFYFTTPKSLPKRGLIQDSYAFDKVSKPLKLLSIKMVGANRIISMGKEPMICPYEVCKGEKRYIQLRKRKCRGSYASHLPQAGNEVEVNLGG
jgi:hypothetical protein